MRTKAPSTDGRLRRLFDMLPWQAGFLNTAGVLEFTNLQSLKDFDMTQEELEQWTSSGIIHVDDHEKNHKAVTALLSDRRDDGPAASHALSERRLSVDARAMRPRP